MTRENITTIQISKETREMLKEFGKMGETYDDVIKRLIRIVKETQVKRREKSDE